METGSHVALIIYISVTALLRLFQVSFAKALYQAVHSSPTDAAARVSSP